MKEIKFFTATWCGACKSIGPHIRALEEDGTLKVGYIDIDEEKVVTKQHGVRRIPTLYYERGNVLVGYHTKDEILTWIKGLPNEEDL